MALMTTSGSMPFSLASASMVCCRGSTLLEVHFQIRSRNHVKRHAMRAPVFAFDDDVPVVHAAQLPLEVALAVDLLAHHQLRAPSREPLVVFGARQRAIEAR